MTDSSGDKLPVALRRASAFEDWRPSKATPGNVWRIMRGYRATCFQRDQRWKWVISKVDRPDSPPLFGQHWHMTREEAQWDAYQTLSRLAWPEGFPEDDLPF